MVFSDVLASIIHDMKNSLGMIINRLDEVVDELPSDMDAASKLTGIQREAKRLNNNLIELLTLYKIENERLSPIIDEVNVQSFLQESIADNLSAANSSSVNLTCNCMDDLIGYFDEGLVHGIINNLIGNALRYCENRIELSAIEKDGYLVLSVEDDGSGFPAAMLKAREAATNSNGITDGRTQLGIHFANLIAQMHKNKGRKGFVQLTNNGNLKGGRFSIHLP